MRIFYAIGSLIPAEDPRPFYARLMGRNISQEIYLPFIKLSEFKAFDTKQKAEEYAANTAKKDKDGKVVAISACIEICIIDDNLPIQKKNDSDAFFVIQNKITSLLIPNASVDIPTAYGEIYYELNGKLTKEIRKESYPFFSDGEFYKIKNDLENPAKNPVSLISNYFRDYEKNGGEHGISEEDLKNPLIRPLIYAASKIYKVDHQDWAGRIAKTLNLNALWSVTEINKFLITQRQELLEKTKDFSASVFLKKLESAIYILGSFQLELAQKLARGAKKEDAAPLTDFFAPAAASATANQMDKKHHDEIVSNTALGMDSP